MCRVRCCAPPFSVLVACLVACSVAAAEKLDRAAQEWLKDVRLLILPEEETSFRRLASAGDRAEFQRIFWARRDPSPGTPANESRDLWEKNRARADDLFGVPGERGSRTGCGQVYLLLGEPYEVKGREVSGRFDSARDIREGPRRPETWIFRTRPGDALQLTAGELKVAFDDVCRFAEGGMVLEELRRAASARVLRHEIEYRITSEGRLEPLKELSGAAGATDPLFREPRHDFPLEAEAKLILRSQTGEAYVALLVSGRIEPAAGGEAKPRLRASARSEGAAGRAVAGVDAMLPLEGDSSFVGSLGLTLKPGRQSVTVAVASSDGRGSVATVPLEVPDFGRSELALGQLLVVPALSELPSGGAADPYAAFAVGSLRPRPRPGNAFSASESLEAFSVIYNAAVSSATGKASVRARFSFLQDGKLVARGGEQTFETPMAVASVGPVPLSGFNPGRYVVRVEVTDTIASKTQSQDVAFQIR
jgi:GWxTD domain-containing protein